MVFCLRNFVLLCVYCVNHILKNEKRIRIVYKRIVNEPEEIYVKMLREVLYVPNHFNILYILEGSATIIYILS